MSANNTVHVTNISGETDDKEIKDFFSFCGKITDIKVTPTEKTKEATVVFEKETAAKTAQLLNNTKLGPNQISVTHEGSGEDSGPTTNADRDSDEITQEEKPRSRIFAEYLAHGYVVGDAALQRAIELDSKHGVSTRFVSTLQGLDTKYHATDRAKTADQSYGITQRAGTLWGGLNSYFEKATNTPTGKKLVGFYTEGSRQVQDIHTEARRLAELKKEEHGGSAYKASGLERVFGKDKSTAAGQESATGSSATATSASGVPQPGPKAGTMESTPIAPTGEAPQKVPGYEKQ